MRAVHLAACLLGLVLTGIAFGVAVAGRELPAWAVLGGAALAAALVAVLVASRGEAV